MKAVCRHDPSLPPAPSGRTKEIWSDPRTTFIVNFALMESCSLSCSSLGRCGSSISVPLHFCLVFCMLQVTL